ncbi:RNase H1/viroplasmin domain-containing protein [Clostridium septicum]|uniref:RNase H1/viroplasmin domain-containing protein n=1 Tax=Clostridium septicum TaxID=1504 RepID=UPI001D159CF1|nr:RNase H1/viroplasmin domain-containing protein [Clostridium septicum]UEC21250.1 RNase H1/viroplasmin domain-containing protein [Clostridium septicum]
MSKKKAKSKFYAIKEGNGVSNLIVNTWGECSKLVLGYNFIYKSFKTREEAEKL